MRNKNRHITASMFDYNKNRYIVIYEDLDNIKRNTYFLLHITFKNISNGEELDCNANTNGMDIEINALKKFFHIQEGIKYIEWIKSFYIYFGKKIPLFVSDIISKEEKDLMIDILDRRESNNKGKYCIGVKRNPIVNGKQYKRTPFNTDKTILLNKDLFEKLGSDKNISFKYSTDKNREKSTIEILLNFANTEQL